MDGMMDGMMDGDMMGMMRMMSEVGDWMETCNRMLSAMMEEQGSEEVPAEPGRQN